MLIDPSTTSLTITTSLRTTLTGAFDRGLNALAYNRVEH